MKRKGFLIIALLIAFGILFAGCTPEATPSLSLSSSSFTTVVGETATIVPVIGGVEGLTMVYASDNEAVATVSDAGVITAVSAGTAKITVSLTDYPEVKVEATVIVKAKAPITLNFSSATLTTVAGRTVSVVPAIGGTSEALELEYASSNTAVATVADGTVTAVAAGQAKITVSVKDQATIKAEVTVTVLPVVTLDDFAPTKVMILGQDEMYVGDVELFPTTITPASAYKGLIWSTSDASVATVDGLGNVSALKSGSVTITATSALDNTIKNDFELEVFEEGTDTEIALNAMAYIKANMPEFANADFDLPVYPNDKLIVTWTKADATAITDGVFAVGTIAGDSQTAVTCKVEYGTFSIEEVLPLKLVQNLDDNGFKTNQIIKDYLDAYFYNYTKTNPDKLAANVILPTQVKGSTIAWATNNAAILSKTGEYVRPNDDQIVTLSATVSTSGVGMPLEYKVFVKGYTIEEKVEYILTTGDLAAYKDLQAQSNIVLPTRDSKFNLLMSWSSSAVTVMDNVGAYVNRDLAEDTDVVYTVTFTDDRTTPAPTATGTVNVKALKATPTSQAVYDFTHDAALMASIPTYFPYGVANRVGGNTISGLPVALTGHDGVTIEWAGNPEDFNGTTLKTQYLRYHESLLTATFKKEGVASTAISFVVNTGISNDANAMYIGGRFSEQTTTVVNDKYDLLNTFSYWDKAVGKTTYTGQQYWSAFSGMTFYVNADVDNPVAPTSFAVNPTGKRYQYFAMDFVVAYITAVDEAGKITGVEYANLREKTGGNWAILFVNLTDKVAKADLAAHAAGNGTDDLPWIAFGLREGALTFDGFRKGFVADATGKVVLGSRFGVLQDALPSTARTVDIPAGGYGMTFKTQENQPVVGIFCQPDAVLTFERYNLASENDFRFMHFNTNVSAAKTKLDSIDNPATDPATLETLAAGVDTNLKAAENYKNYDSAVLTPLADIAFDMTAFNAQAARSALLWDVKVAALKADQAAEDYLTKLQALYTPYSALTQGVKNLIVDHVWLENEYTSKLNTFYIDLVLNDGQVYATTRKEITDMFIADLYAHLQAKNYPGLVDFATFSDTTVATPHLNTLMTDAFMREWVYDLYKANASATADPDHLKIDDSSNDFFRQTAYHDKWLPMLLYINDTTQIGHGGGRDILGRFGLLYQFVYEIPVSTSPLHNITVSAIDGATTRFREYITGKYAYAAYREKFVANTWTVNAAVSQTKVDAMDLKYTPGDATVALPAVLKAGFTLEWYLDAAFTLPATLTPAGLGNKDVVLYAKWTAVNPG